MLLHKLRYTTSFVITVVDILRVFSFFQTASSSSSTEYHVIRWCHSLDLVTRQETRLYFITSGVVLSLPADCLAAVLPCGTVVTGLLLTRDNRRGKTKYMESLSCSHHQHHFCFDVLFSGLCCFCIVAHACVCVVCSVYYSV